MSSNITEGTYVVVTILAECGCIPPHKAAEDGRRSRGACTKRVASEDTVFVLYQGIARPS